MTEPCWTGDDRVRVAAIDGSPSGGELDWLIERLSAFVEAGGVGPDVDDLRAAVAVLARAEGESAAPALGCLIELACTLQDAELATEVGSVTDAFVERPGCRGPLLRAVEDPRFPFNWRLTLARRLGAEALPAWVELIPEAVYSVAGLRRAQSALLDLLDEPLGPVALERLYDSVSWLKRRIVLAELGAPRHAPAVAVLVGLALRADPATRRAIAEALGRIADPGAEPWLIEALSSVDDGLRTASARALGRLGTPAALVGLRQVEAGDPDAAARRAAGVAADAILARYPSVGSAAGGLSVAPELAGALGLSEAVSARRGAVEQLLAAGVRRDEDADVDRWDRLAPPPRSVPLWYLLARIFWAGGCFTVWPWLALLASQIIALWQGDPRTGVVAAAYIVPCMLILTVPFSAVFPLRERRLLRHGVASLGVLQGHETRVETRTRRGSTTLHDYTFEFLRTDGDLREVVRTYPNRMPTLEDDAFEPLLHDAERGQVLLYHELENLRIDARGRLRARSRLRAAAAFAVPLLALGLLGVNVVGWRAG